eukprot:364341-Chlamydomonas_euryale.AAC.5
MAAPVVGQPRGASCHGRGVSPATDWMQRLAVLGEEVTWQGSDMAVRMQHGRGRTRETSKPGSPLWHSLNG